MSDGVVVDEGNRFQTENHGFETCSVQISCARYGV